MHCLTLPKRRLLLPYLNGSSWKPRGHIFCRKKSLLGILNSVSKNY
eukprot:13479.XXX_1094015_1094152_1 [CDS] Oithona nana genome sequencing.